MEIYKSVINYEGLYEVSNYGNVKSFWLSNGRILKPQVGGGGYLHVSLCKDGQEKSRKIHQLVAESFLNHIPCGMNLVVNHKDFNKQNNHITNLEIITQRENANRKHIKSLSQYTGVTWQKQTNKWRSRITINGKLKHLGYFANELDASKVYQEIIINQLK